MNQRKNKLRNGAVNAIRWFDALVRAKTGKVLVTESLGVTVMTLFVMPPCAYAADFSFDKVFARLNDVMTYLLLPVGIAWASWQIVYIAVVCGVIGIDPLNLLGGDLDQDRVWQEVRGRFRNFGYGIAWVAGIWLLFELVLFLVSQLTGVIATNMR